MKDTEVVEVELRFRRLLESLNYKQVMTVADCLDQLDKRVLRALADREYGERVDRGES